MLSKYLAVLKDENVLVRAAAYEALVPFGASARTGFSELIDQLKNKNDVDRLNLAIALGIVQPSDTEIFAAAVSVLQELSTVPRWELMDVSMRAAAALRHIEDAAKRTMKQ